MTKRRNPSVLAVLAILMVLAWAFTTVRAAGAQPLKDNICGICHKDFQKMLPKDHPDIGGNAGKSCLECHGPRQTKGDTAKFTDLIHKNHQGGKTTLECTACHAM